jgi:hypothetical protein
MIQHDMELFDHGMPRAVGSVSKEQRPEADVNIEIQVKSKFAAQSQELAWALESANENYATDYPATIGSHMANTDSGPIQDAAASVSVRENERGAQIGKGWDPRLGLQHYQENGFIPDAVSDTSPSDGYPGHKRPQVAAHVNRAWNWIDRQGFIEPAPGMNGRNGWRSLTDEGRAIAEGANLDEITARQEFPRALLHKAIIEKCEGQFMSGHYADAVEKTSKVVCDRLCTLTTYEKGSEAFGKGKLHIKVPSRPLSTGTSVKQSSS